MSIVSVQRILPMEAINTTDADWRVGVRSWAERGLIPVEDEQQLGDLLSTIEQHIEGMGAFRPWIIRDGQGLEIIHPATFANRFEDVHATEVLDEVWQRRAQHAEKGYTATHDDVHGLGHIVTHAVRCLNAAAVSVKDREASIRSEILDAMSLLHAGLDLIDRGESKDRTLPVFYNQHDMTRVEEHYTQRIWQHLGDLDDLRGQAQDEEDSTPEEAVGWAEARFKTTFGITDNEKE